MRSRRHAFVVTGIVMTVLLVPALIWSGKRSIDGATRETAVKLPEVSTIGAEIKPYVLTPLERGKLALPVYSGLAPFDQADGVEPQATIGNEGPYPGMTSAELDKLAEWRTGSLKASTSGTPTEGLRRGEPVSTIEIVPRAPGVEGLTPQEKAKLEAHIKEKK